MNDKSFKEKRSTFNVQHSTSKVLRLAAEFFGCWGLNIERWMFLHAFLICLPVSAQTPAPQPDPLMQLMLTQPSIEVSTNVEIRAVFDPPVVSVGEKSTYRVTINAVSDSIKWPEDIYAPSELTIKRSARGQILQPAGPVLKPMTTINHHVTATTAGSFTIPEFKVKVYGRNITVPAARLMVVTNVNVATPQTARLFVELSETNIYSGQPVKVRVLMPATLGNFMQALQQVQLNGDGILLDQSAVRQRIQQMGIQGRSVVPVYSQSQRDESKAGSPSDFQGRSGPTFIYESTLIPLVAGKIDVTAQAFTAGNQFSGSIVIQGNTVIQGGAPQYLLLDSDSVRLNVQPLPRAGELPGFNGAIGQFTLEPPQLSTNRVRVGDVVKLQVMFRTDGDIKRLLAPPPPALTNWQMFPPVAEGGLTLSATANGISSAQTFSYTLIPLTNNMTVTPAIPFSYFDPQQKTYVNATIPPVPIEVLSGGATAEAQAIAQVAAAATNERKLKLSALATIPGRTASLVPLQLRDGFLWGQFVPLFGFTGLWLWDRRRRFYELHPHVLVRKRALRALRRERVTLQQAAQANDAVRFANVAVSALRIASAPHFPATPRALVGRDVLELLDEADRNGQAGEVVRKIFSATDAAQFSIATMDATDMLTLQPELDRVLDRLEEKLK